MRIKYLEVMVLGGIQGDAVDILQVFIWLKNRDESAMLMEISEVIYCLN